MGKKELAAWLAGPYAEVTRHSLPVVVAPPPTAEVRSLVVRRSLPPYAVSRVMREAHEEIVETLRILAVPDGGVAFAYHALNGLVVRCREASGDREGFAPAADPRMRLAERVMALLAVDYLTRPEDYETQLAICTRCTLIAFDGAARARGVCRVHSASGIRFRDSEMPPALAKA